MPRKKDKNGKVYAWSDDGLALYFQLSKANAALSSISASKEYPKLEKINTETLYPLIQNTYSGTGDYNWRVFHNGNDRWIKMENKALSVNAYFLPEDHSLVKEYLKNCSEALLKKGQELSEDKKYDKVRRYYEEMAFVAKPDQGNLLEAFATKPYMAELVDLTGTAPRFDVLGLDACIDGLNNQTNDKGEPQPVFDTFMDIMSAGTEELKVEYHRQKLAEDGWTPQSERTYLEELKAAHEKTVTFFDKLWNIEDHGQYDQFLNNSFDHTLGKHPDNNRDITRHIGQIRGEIKAIENGWSSKDLALPGLVGALEAQLEKRKLQVSAQIKEYENKENSKAELKQAQEKMRSLNSFEADLKKLKDAVWDKKITSVDDKKEVLDKIRTFVEEHRQHDVVNKVYYGEDYGCQEIYERAMDSVERDHAWEHQNDKALDAVKTKEDLDFVEAGELNNTKVLTSIRVQVKTLAMEAGEKLAALEKMTKEGHINGPEYNAMHDALKKVSELDPAKDSIDNVTKAVDKLNKASHTYETTHNGLFVAAKGYGEDRKKMSIELQHLTEDFSRNFDIDARNYQMNSDRVIEDLIRHNAKTFPQIDYERKVRNLNVNDLAKKIGALDKSPINDHTKKRIEEDLKKPGFRIAAVEGEKIDQNDAQKKPVIRQGGI